MAYDPPKSRPIVVIPYTEAWADEFNTLGTRLRSILQNEALRIDHIGSTSVPGLAAKDIIDIQVTVADLDNMASFIDRMCQEGFVHREKNLSDEFVGEIDPGQLRKRYFREADGDRSVHIHVRQDGLLNQRYPILFRDFLRSNATVRAGYEQIKLRLAEIFPESIEGYLYIKDPLMDIIFEGATVWARETDWRPDADHL
jgi:GrpB-like predicted nucleotidyltransferase (UPF0157 family)